MNPSRITTASAYFSASMSAAASLTAMCGVSSISVMRGEGVGSFDAAACAFVAGSCALAVNESMASAAATSCATSNRSCRRACMIRPLVRVDGDSTPTRPRNLGQRNRQYAAALPRPCSDVVDACRQLDRALVPPVRAFGHVVMAQGFRPRQPLLTAHDEHVAVNLDLEVAGLESRDFERDLDRVCRIGDLRGQKTPARAARSRALLGLRDLAPGARMEARQRVARELA